MHDRTQIEKERIEQRLRQGKTQGRTYSQLSYYGDAFHISYEYLGQRNDIATVFIQKHAVALATRLKACDEVMDGQARMGDGTPLTPDDQWNDQPDLPGCVSVSDTMEEAKALIDGALESHLEAIREDNIALPEPRSRDAVLAAEEDSYIEDYIIEVELLS